MDEGERTITDLVSQDIGTALDDAMQLGGHVILEARDGFQVWLNPHTQRFEIRERHQTHPPTA